jgi:hypothetical protein
MVLKWVGSDGLAIFVFVDGFLVVDALFRFFRGLFAFFLAGGGCTKSSVSLLSMLVAFTR